MILQFAQNAVQEFHNQTTIHPLGFALMVTAALATLGLPRRWASLPLLMMVCMVSPAQRIVIATLDFDFIRILVLVGWLRVFVRGELKGFRWMLLDTLMVAWAIVGTIAYTALWGTGAAFVFKLGYSYTALGLYFYFRWVIRDWSDYKRVCVSLMVIAIPVAALFLLEQATGRNLFSVFGGVSEQTIVRNGRMRAQGPFSHPIIAGCYWATTIFVIASAWKTRGSARWLSWVGVAAALVIIGSTASSTPVAALFAGGAAWCLFRVRQWLGWIRLGIVMMLIVLHFLMSKPVWHLISRIDLVGGSTGWHRYFLIDNAINRFGEWAVVGVKSTAHWGHAQNDVTNQYILEGVRGGFLSLVLFVACLWCAFAYVGKLLRATQNNEAKLFLSWGMGVALFTHASSFMAVSYFGQITVLWYLNLAAPACLLSAVRLESNRALLAGRARRSLGNDAAKPEAAAAPFIPLPESNGANGAPTPPASPDP